MSLMGVSSSGRSMTPIPPSQPPPPPPSSAVGMPSSANSQSAAASATNQATVGMGALNLGSFNISSLLNQALNPALNPALLAAAQAAIWQTLAQTSQLSGSPTAADISSALLGSMSTAATMGHGQPTAPQPPAPAPPGVSASCAPAAWWPSHSTSVAPIAPSSAVPPSAAMTTTMSGDIVGAANGSQSARSVPMWSQEEGWRK